MLDVYLHDGAESLRFSLSGELTGKWAAELEQSWHTARSTSGHKRLVVDLADVVALDSAGETVLRQMADAGAAFITGSEFTDSLARRLTERQSRFIESHSPGLLRSVWCRLTRCCRRVGVSLRQRLPCAHFYRRVW